jgi:5-hydroxyisourate hydrolase
VTDVSLSTHVLDTGAGRPAAAVLVELFRGGDLVASARTNEDGRVAEVAAGLEPGRYQLVFHPPSPFFRRIALELELGAGHHHVPLLVSSFGCASYRGS